MNISEANAVNVVLGFFLGLHDDGSVRSTAEHHAVWLADRAHTALSAGVTGKEVHEAWQRHEFHRERREDLHRSLLWSVASRIANHTTGKLGEARLAEGDWIAAALNEWVNAGADWDDRAVRVRAVLRAYTSLPRLEQRRIGGSELLDSAQRLYTNNAPTDTKEHACL